MTSVVPPSPPSQGFTQVPSLDNTFGAILLGTFASLALYGLLIHQSYRYFQLYPKDCVWTKALVLYTLIFETFHVVLSTHSCYYYLVTNYLSPAADLSSVWSLSLLSATTSFIIIPIQSFFARRIFLLGGPTYRALVIFTSVLFLAELGFLCTATTEALVFDSFMKNTWLISAGAGTIFVADALLTIALVHLLHSKRTGVKRMDHIVETLILYGINTGLLTSLITLLSLIFSLIFPKNLVWGGFAMVTTKMYAVSLLAALNTRNALQYAPNFEQAHTTESGTLVTTGRGGITAFELQTLVPTSPHVSSNAIQRECY